MMEYTVIRSSRRTLCLEITRDLRVLVRVPRRTREEDIRRFVEEHRSWIAEKLAKQAARPETPMEREISPEQEAALRRQAATYFPERVAVYAARMGIQPTGIRITGAQKRFGSCSSRNSLCFSWRLMLYPPEAIDYVVVHELAHIRHHDHSAAFWTLVEKTLPDYRRRQALLHR